MFWGEQQPVTAFVVSGCNFFIPQTFSIRSLEIDLWVALIFQKSEKLIHSHCHFHPTGLSIFLLYEQIA